MYLAIIGDFIDSKNLEDRSNYQKQLQKTLDLLNQKYKMHLASKMSITLDDEFQALFKEDAPIFQIIDELSIAMKPVDIRYGIGYGEILTTINPEQSLGADGPAYWNAREAITFIHQRNDYGQTHLAIRTGSETDDIILNSLLSAGEAIKSNWITSQIDVYETLLKEDIYQEQFDQQEIGEKLSLNSSALSKRLKSSNIKVYFRTRQSARLYLSQLKKEIKK